MPFLSGFEGMPAAHNQGVAGSCQLGPLFFKSKSEQ